MQIAYILVLIATVLIVFFNIFEKKILVSDNVEHYAFSYSAYLLLFSCISLLIFGFTVPQSSSIPTLLLAAVVGCAAFITRTYGVKNTPISISSAMTSSTPVLTTIVSILIFKEHLEPLQILGIIVVSISTFFISRTISQVVSDIKRSGIIYLGVSLVFISLVANLGRFTIHTLHVHPLVFLFYVELIQLLFFSLFLLFKEKNNTNITQTFKDGGFALFGLSLISFIVRICTTFALRELGAGVISAIKDASALPTIIIGGKFFHEERLLEKTIYGVGIIAGVCLVLLS